MSLTNYKIRYNINFEISLCRISILQLTEKQTLLDEMKKHLETSQTEIELKDDTVKNLENKLTNTRLDLSSMERKNRDLEETVMSLNKSLETARAYQESLMRNVTKSETV